MRWEVFRQDERGNYHKHCGDVHAPDREMATLFARIQHGRRMTTNSLWVVPSDAVTEIDADDTAFGGRTDKAYRWATTYSVDASFAEEVAESETEQAAAERSEVGGSGATETSKASGETASREGERSEPSDRVSGETASERGGDD